jgi:hypothetical protein
LHNEQATAVLAHLLVMSAAAASGPTRDEASLSTTNIALLIVASVVTAIFAVVSLVLYVRPKSCFGGSQRARGPPKRRRRKGEVHRPWIGKDEVLPTSIKPIAWSPSPPPAPPKPSATSFGPAHSATAVPSSRGQSPLPTYTAAETLSAYTQSEKTISAKTLSDSSWGPTPPPPPSLRSAGVPTVSTNVARPPRAWFTASLLTSQRSPSVAVLSTVPSRSTRRATGVAWGRTVASSEAALSSDAASAAGTHGFSLYAATTIAPRRASTVVSDESGRSRGQRGPLAISWANLSNGTRTVVTVE